MSAGAVTMAAGVGYLVGSLPLADIVARRRGVALRHVGDGNPGYWNARASIGRRAARPVLIGDMLKGAVAAGVGVLVAERWWVGYVAAAAAMIGHAWPVFARFRGGRSVLAFVGAMCVLAPFTAAVCAAAGLAVIASSRSFAWGARVGVFAVPVVQAFVEPRAHVAATGALMTIIGVRFALAAARTVGSTPGRATSGAAGGR